MEVNQSRWFKSKIDGCDLLCSGALKKSDSEELARLVNSSDATIGAISVEGLESEFYNVCIRNAAAFEKAYPNATVIDSPLLYTGRIFLDTVLKAEAAKGR